MSDTIRFLLNGEARSLHCASPRQTVLHYLRGTEHLTGTKEGCGAGSCGACTVVLGEPDGDGLRYRAVTACLLPVTALHGKLLLSIEGLTGTDGALHPVQQSLVDHHASHCGFCTPGAALSLFALYQQGAGDRPARDAVVEALSGNLCRCTGYRPMVDAGLTALSARGLDRAAELEATWAARLRDIADGPDPAYEADGLGYFGPTRVDALRDLLGRHPEARIACGGTASAPGGAADAPPVLISIADVAELRGVAVGPEGVVIGAAAPYADVSPRVASAYPGLAELIDRVGSLQTRHRGTFGGALSFPAPSGDIVPAVMALDGTIVLLSAEGERRVAADAFVAGAAEAARRPGEIIARIELPPPTPDRLFGAYKVSKRHDMSFPAISAAFSVRLDDGVVAAARAAYVGLDLGAIRLPSVEAVLTGRPWTLQAVQLAANALPADLTPRDDFHGGAAYRLRVAGNLLRRFYWETTAAGVPTRVVAL